MAARADDGDQNEAACLFVVINKPRGDFHPSDTEASASRSQVALPVSALYLQGRLREQPTVLPVSV
jgi:hypothetical protein